MGNEAGETTGRYVLIDGVVYISSSVSNYLLGSSLSFINTSTLYSVADRTEETPTARAPALPYPDRHPVQRGAGRHPLDAPHHHCV